MIAATAVATQLSAIVQYNTTQYNTVYNGGQKGEGGYAVSRWTLNRWVLSPFRKIVSDSAVLRTAGSSFRHWGPKTEKSCDFAELLAMAVRPDIQLR